MNPCCDFFEAHAENNQVVKALQQIPDAIAWESLSASRHADQPVENAEAILRLHFQPIHIDPETGDLKPTALDDVSNKGLSVDRMTLRRYEESVEVGRAAAAEKTAQNPEKPRQLLATSQFLASEVRAIEVEAKRAFAVYSTALPENQAHADVCQLATGPEKIRRSARSRLLDLALAGLVSCAG